VGVGRKGGGGEVGGGGGGGGFSLTKGNASFKSGGKRQGIALHSKGEKKGGGGDDELNKGSPV